MTRRLVLIEWIDSRGARASWIHTEDAHDGTCALKSVGWVIAENDELIQIAPHIGDEPEQVCGDMTIPKVAVVKVTTLTKKRSSLTSASDKLLRDSRRSKKGKTAAGRALSQRARA